jgi:ABC-type branched-subunit amino acid transport system substrate-binding protein
MRNNLLDSININWFSTSSLRLLVLGLFASLFLVGCAPPENIFDRDLPLGSIWSVQVEENGKVNWGSASGIAQEQHVGYDLAGETLEDRYREIVSSEGNQQDDVQVAVREMVEDSRNPVVAVVGATTNEATMRAASLVNFFNVPMIVPSAVGDNILPSNNLWAFRLSASSSAFASYVFGTLLTKDEFGVETDDTNTQPKLNIAVLYEGNTFGESAAVATARAARQMGVGVGVYASFPPKTPDPARLNVLMHAIKDEEVHLVYLISSDPAVARLLVQTIKKHLEANERPVLVGQAGGFASQEFLESADAERVYIVRQKLVTNNCPEDLTSLYQGQTYAAVYLLDQAIQQAKDDQPVLKWYQVNPLNRDTNELADFREDIRDILRQVEGYFPCVGPVEFDNMGQLKQPVFELIMMRNGIKVPDPMPYLVNDIDLEIGEGP